MTKRTLKRKSNVRRRLTFSKKRRTTRRGRGRKSVAFTSQSGSGGAVNYKARKTSRRAYKRHLWNSTLFKEHYRSIGAVGTTLNTPASLVQVAVLVEKAIENGISFFWAATGGAIAPDSSQTLPPFTGDVIIRGGKIGLRLANTLDTVASAATTIQGTAILIRTSKAFSAAAITTPQSLGWDTTLVPDFDTTVGRILYRKNFLLKDSETALIEYRLKLEKVDVGDFNANRNVYMWVILAGNTDNSAAYGLAVSKYFNLSFSADAV